MKILHLMLSNFYIDNAFYQENIIPKINKRDGHEVEIFASTEVFIRKNQLGLTSPSEYYSEDGIKVTRLPYVKIFNSFISKKIRAYSRLYEKIATFNPEIIFFHGAAAWAINTVARYKKNNLQVRLYIDSHEDKHNSARNHISRFLLYDCFYSPILRFNLKHIDKLYYITKETLDFINETYKINDEKLHFLPLGGIIPLESDRLFYRNKTREALGLEANDILCLHSGKLNNLKRSIETIEGFSNNKNANCKLVIIGSLENEIEEEFYKLIAKDDRINFIGWKTSKELQEYLMAGDLYLQLGTQSVTMQQALCNGCPVAVYPYESHTFLLKENAFYIESSKDITNLLMDIHKNPAILNTKKNHSFIFAKNSLDYNKLSNVFINK